MSDSLSNKLKIIIGFQPSVQFLFAVIAMSSMFWVGASLLASEIGFFSTLIVNSFLVHLIIFYTKQVFGAYKYLVLSFSLMGIVFATAEFIVKPVTDTYQKIWKTLHN